MTRSELARPKRRTTPRAERFNNYLLVLVAAAAALLAWLAVFARPADAAEIDYKLVYVDNVTDFTSDDLKDAYKKQTGEEIEGEEGKEEIRAAGKARPELAKEVRKFWSEAGFTVTDEKGRVRDGNGAIVKMRVLDEKSIKALNEEGAATVLLIPVVGFFLALEKQARVQMRCDVETVGGENVWTGEHTKTWKTDFFGGLFKKTSRLRRGARGDCIKALAKDYMTFAEGKQD